MTFGEKLQELRKASGLTQDALATMIDIPIGSLRNHEQDIREPAASTIYDYAKALNVDCRAFANCEFRSKSRTAPKPEAKKRGKK